MQDADTPRVKRLKRVATILYGEGRDGEPKAGWRSALAKQMGVRPSTIAETAANQALVSVFDRRLAEVLRNTILPTMRANIVELEELAELMKEKPKMTEKDVLAQRRELQAEYDRLCEIIDADVSAKLNKEWLKVQEPMFTAGQPAVVYDELQARLDDIAARRDAAWAEEKAAWQRRSEISEILYGRGRREGQRARRDDEITQEARRRAAVDQRSGSGKNGEKEMNRHPNESWAATHALDAILGEHGVDAPAVSAAGWLKTLLDEIDASPEIKRILERDDPDSMREMLHECREMSDGLMTALLLMVPPDEANLGYQACVELEREIRADGIAEGDTITITRNDQGDEAGYQLIHDRLGDGLDCWSFDNLGQPILSHTAERV